MGGAVGPPAGDGAGRPGRDADKHHQAEQEYDESPHGTLLLLGRHHCHLSGEAWQLAKVVTSWASLSRHWSLVPQNDAQAASERRGKRPAGAVWCPSCAPGSPDPSDPAGSMTQALGMRMEPEVGFEPPSSDYESESPRRSGRLQSDRACSRWMPRRSSVLSRCWVDGLLGPGMDATSDIHPRRGPKLPELALTVA